MTTFYRVIATLPRPGYVHPPRDVSTGFSSRQAAERFAVGLAAAGQCTSVEIEPYEADVASEGDGR